MGYWTDAVLRILGGYPQGSGGIMYMVLLAAVVFLVMLSVHEHKAAAGADHSREDGKN